MILLQIAHFICVTDINLFEASTHSPHTLGSEHGFDYSQKLLSAHFCAFTEGCIIFRDSLSVRCPNIVRVTVGHNLDWQNDVTCLFLDHYDQRAWSRLSGLCDGRRHGLTPDTRDVDLGLGPWLRFYWGSMHEPIDRHH